MLRHLPNAITASRGVAGIAVAALLQSSHPRWALIAFSAAMLTDLVDGALARALNAEGELGKWLDPISDKALTNITWLGLWLAGWVSPWIVGLLWLRDAITGVVYTNAHRRGRTFAVNHAGRVAVSMEATALGILLFHGPWLNVQWQSVGSVVAWVCIGLNIIAAVQYIRTGPDADA